MENNPVNPATGKTKKIVLISFGTLVLSTLAFFGIKKVIKTKNETTNEKDNNETDFVDTKSPVQNSSVPVHRAAVSSFNGDAPFPLAVGSKGNNIRTLQQSIIGKHGRNVLAKYGADGYFGNELEVALRTLGYAIPLQEVDYKKITEKKSSEALKAFDAASVAYGIYVAINAWDYPTAITLLKAITTTSNYVLVSEQFKQYFIGGVRQTLVNAMLTVFKEKSQRENIQRIFKNMGLKYDGQKWFI